MSMRLGLVAMRWMGPAEVGNVRELVLLEVVVVGCLVVGLVVGGCWRELDAAKFVSSCV